MPYRYTWYKFRDFVKFRILHVDDTPHQIAFGAALAIFVAWTPTIGLQITASMLLAHLFRANKAITIPAVWLSNPVTVVPLFYVNWLVGRSVVPEQYRAGQIDLSVFVDSGGAEVATWSQRFIMLFDPTFWLKLSSKLLGLGLELWVGSIIMGVLMGALFYSLVYWGVVEYRTKYRPDLLPRVKAAGRKLADAALEKAHLSKQKLDEKLHHKYAEGKPPIPPKKLKNKPA
jgi:hypothetical protein